MDRIKDRPQRIRCKDLYLGFRHCGSTTAIRLDNAKLHSEELAKDNVTIDYEGYSLKFTVTSVSPT